MPASLAPAALLPLTDGPAGPWSLLALLLYLTFVPHVLLMNAVVGTAALCLLAHLKPSPAAPPDGTELLLPKGVAFVVNFGVPPFLFIQAAYGQFIYSGSVVMALWWLSLMAVVMLAYYGLYINMPGRGLGRGARTAALGFSLALLLFAAFVLVNSATFAQNPARWAAYAAEPGGVSLNLADPQLWPRYLHVLLSCLAVGGLCLALPAAFALREKARYPLDPDERERFLLRRRKGLRIFIHATLAQFPVGLWFLMALPRAQRLMFMGGDAFATALFCASLVCTLAALFAARKDKSAAAAVLAALTVALMAGMRGLLRFSMLETALGPAFSPPVSPLEAGPLAMFICAALASGIGLFFMLRLYFRHGLDKEGDATPDREERLRVLLADEIAKARADGPPDAGNGGRP